MRDVILRLEAALDIEDIADYTLQQWGKGQARELSCRRFPSAVRAYQDSSLLSLQSFLYGNPGRDTMVLL